LDFDPHHPAKIVPAPRTQDSKKQQQKSTNTQKCRTENEGPNSLLKDAGQENAAIALVTSHQRTVGHNLIN